MVSLSYFIPIHHKVIMPWKRDFYRTFSANSSCHRLSITQYRSTYHFRTFGQPCLYPCLLPGIIFSINKKITAFEWQIDWNPVQERPEGSSPIGKIVPWWKSYCTFLYFSIKSFIANASSGKLEASIQPMAGLPLLSQINIQKNTDGGQTGHLRIFAYFSIYSRIQSEAFLPEHIWRASTGYGVSNTDSNSANPCSGSLKRHSHIH